MTLSNDSIQKLLPLLRPHLRDENERRAYLIRALGMKTPVLNRLVLNTSVDVFITNMVQELVDFGEIAPSKPALCALLEAIYEEVGVDNQAKIDDLLRQLRNELTETPVNGEQAQSRQAVMLNKQAIQPLNKPPSLSSEIPQNIPRTGVVEFVGRTDELHVLHQKLQEKNRGAISAIAGMGGVGKTELAIQYALTHQEDYPGGICWLQARDENIGNQIVDFVQSNLGLKIPENIKTLDNQIRWCWQYWSEGDVLIIFDDVNDYKNIKSYLPSANTRFRVLITTRLELLTSAQRLELKVLKIDAAIALLESFLNEKRIQKEKISIQEICRFCGCLPLGIELVGRYLQHKPDLLLAEMLQNLEAKKLEQQALKKPEKFTSDMTAKLGVAAAFDLSWQELNSMAKELSLLLCIFDLVPVSWQLVEQCFPEQDKENLEYARDNFLVYFHLLQHEGKQTYKLHELIREFFQSKLAELAQTNLLEAIALKIGEFTAKSPLCITEILQKGLLNWKSSSILQMSALEWGKQLWIASKSWCDGLDKLAKLVIPLREDETLPVLGVALIQKNPSSFRDSLIKHLPHTGAIVFERELIDNPNLLSLATGWYFGYDIKENIVELPLEIKKILEDDYTDFFPLSLGWTMGLGWNNFKSSLVNLKISTAWEYIGDDIISKLSELLNSRSLPVPSGYLSLEAAWYGAIYLTKKHLINSLSNDYYHPISLNEIENHVSKINQYEFSLMIQHCLNQLRIEIETYRAKGQTHLSFSSSVQEFKTSPNYSPEILLNYTTDVFQQAIESYGQLVNSLFPKLIPKLQIASILPARIVGYIIPPQYPSESIIMNWHWESLSKSEKSYADFRVAEDKNSLPPSFFSKTPLFPKTLKTSSISRLLGTNPVTEIVYKWLWEDLKKIGWVKGDGLKDANYFYWR